MVPQWLMHNAPGYGAMSPEAREALSSFVLLWSLFEGLVLDTHASPAKLIEQAQLWGEGDGLPTAGVTSSVAYFSARYFEGGIPNAQFDSLNFRQADRRGEVEAVLSGQTVDPVNQAAAVMLIIYRLRNNLFHGVKWAAGLHDQQQNFEHANVVLIDAINALGRG